MKKNKMCQSCGMPLKKDPQGGGTNADGSQNALYCSYCFQEGEFTQQDITASEMQDFVKGKMVEMGTPKIFAHLLSRNVPRLERWKTH